MRWSFDDDVKEERKEGGSSRKEEVSTLEKENTGVMMGLQAKRMATDLGRTRGYCWCGLRQHRGRRKGL